MFLDEKKIGEAPAETKPLEPWRQILLRGADYIDKHGWCQWALENALGQVCLLGALLKAEGKSHSDPLSSNFNSAFSAVGRCLDRHDLAGWNNAPARTKDEVVAVMREAAHC